MSIDVKTVIKRDRNDKDLFRVGRTAYAIRAVDGVFQIEDARRWEPTVAVVGSYDLAVQYIEELLTSAPR